MMKSPSLPKDFPQNRFVATLNHGVNTRYGARATTFGKLVFPAFPQEIEEERLNYSLRIALAYNGFDIRRTPKEDLLFRTLVKGIGSLDEEEKLQLGATVRDAVSVGIDMITGPAGSFVLDQIEGAKDSVQGVLSKSSSKRRVVSPVTEEALAEITLNQTLYDTSDKVPKAVRDAFHIQETMPARGVIILDAQVSFVGKEVKALLQHVEDHGITSGSKYGAPRFVLRFEHTPVLDEIAMTNGSTRNVLMCANVQREKGKVDSGYVHIPIERGLSDKELFEQQQKMGSMTREIERLLTKLDRGQEPLDQSAVLRKVLESQMAIAQFNQALIKAQVGVGARTDF